MFDRPVPGAPPERIVDASGRPVIGVFNKPFRSVNLCDARPAVGPFGLPGRLARFRLKEWQHFAIVLPDALLCFAIVDSKFLRLSWCHFARIDGSRHFEHVRKGVRLDMALSTSLWNEQCHVTANGYRIRVHNHLDVGEHRIHIYVRGDGDKASVEANLVCKHDLEAIEPLVVVLPVGRGRAMYSHKVALPVEGTLRIDGGDVEVPANDAFAILDIHKAHYPRHTWWNWATFAGRDTLGRFVALNLTHNVNDRDDEVNENGLWVDGKLTSLSPARFRLDRKDVMKPWRLTTMGGEVELDFQPRGERAEALRLGLVRSVFHQPFGTFKGTIRVDDLNVAVDGVAGVCEDHDALW